MAGTSRDLVLPLLGWLTVLLCTAWGEAPEARAGAADSPPAHVIRMCILPFYTSSWRASPDSDLAPLLEADLAGNRWLEFIPARTVYELSYELESQPWLVKGIWERDSEARDAEAYLWFRERLLQRARTRFSCDYYVSGRVIATGSKRNVTVEVVEPGPQKRPAFASAREADSADAIPQALRQIAAEIRDFLEPRWSEGALEKTRRRYLAQLCSLETAVREAEERVKAHPEAVSLRVRLLSLYEEDKEAYGSKAGDLAAEMVGAWDARHEDVIGLAERLGVDPFLVLCREQARAGDWSGVRRTAGLGLERYPLRSAEYGKCMELAREQPAPALVEEATGGSGGEAAGQ